MRSEIRRQSGVVPYRLAGDGIEVLLITPTGGEPSGGRKWIFPKGTVEPHLESGESALKEAFEEAGAIGRLVGPSVGAYEYDKHGTPCEVEVFLMEVHEVLDDWEESDVRQRRWFKWEDARSAVQFEGPREFVERLPELLDELKKRR